MRKNPIEYSLLWIVAQRFASIDESTVPQFDRCRSVQGTSLEKGWEYFEQVAALKGRGFSRAKHVTKSARALQAAEKLDFRNALKGHRFIRAE
jgi:hypothetical protein